MNVHGGDTDVTTYFSLRLSATGAEATALDVTTFDLQYVRNGAAPSAKVDATALGATDSAHADNKAIEIDATDQPGLYRVDWPDAAFAAGVREVILTVKCATCFTEHLRVSIDPPVNVERWNGTDVPAEHTAGYPIVTVKDGTGTGEINTNGGVVDANVMAWSGNGDAVQLYDLDGDGNYAPLVAAQLMDGVAHGGMPGASTATLAIQSVAVSNPAGDGVSVSTVNGNGISITAAGSGKHDINLAGSGTINGDLAGTIDGLTAAGLATFFTVNSTKTYADAVAGSPVKETADTLLTRIGTPANLGSGATVAGNLVDIEAQTDDIASIVTATGAGDLTTKTADSGAVVTGTNTSGTFADTATDNDTYWITAPTGSGLRQNLVFNMPLGRVPISIIVRAWWNGSGQVADVYALNSRTGAYDKLTNTGTNLASRNTELLYQLPLPRDYADSAGGLFNVVTLEFRSASTNVAHRLRLDQVLVSHVSEAVAVTLTAPTTAEIWTYPDRTLTSPGEEPGTSPTAEEIADAVRADLSDGTAEISLKSLSLVNLSPGGDALFIQGGTNGRAAVVSVGVGGTLFDFGATGAVPASIAAGKIATDAIDAASLKADAVAEIQAGLSTLGAADVRTAVGMSAANLDSQLATITGFIDTEVAAVLAAVDTEVAAIKAKTDNLPALPASQTNLDVAVSTRLAAGSYTIPPTAAENATAILAAGNVDGFTLEETLKLCLAALGGKLSGAATTTITIRAADDSKDRIIATVDSNGNRTSVTLDAAG